MARPPDSFTPDSIVIGHVPLGAGSEARDAAYWEAQRALDEEALHLLLVEGQDEVRFMAAPSRDFVGAPFGATSILAAAFPGHPGHVGDGAYLADAPTGVACIVCKHGELLLFVGDRNAVEAFARHNEADIVEPSSGAGPAWEGFRIGSLRRHGRMAMTALLAAAAVSIVMAVVWVASALTLSGSAEVEAQIRSTADAGMRAAAQELTKAVRQPLADDLSYFQQIAAITAGTGGWIKEFKITNGQATWSAEFPMWVTADQLQALGRNLKTRADDAKGVVIVEGSR